MSMEDSVNRQAETERLTPAEQTLAAMDELAEQLFHLVRCGVAPEIALVWLWLYREARYRPATITIRTKELADALDKERQAACANLDRMKDLLLCPIVEGKRGRGGGTVVAVENPFDAFTDQPRRVAAPNQNEFAFIAELDAAEAEEEACKIRDEEPAVVAIGSASVKCNPGDAQGCILPPEPKCNPDPSEGCIYEVESGDRPLLPAPLVERCVAALGSEAVDTWLGGRRYEWRSPELKLFCDNEFIRGMINRTTAPALLKAGREFDADFRLEITVDTGPPPLNATLWPTRVAFDSDENATLAAQRTNNLRSEVAPLATSERTNERNERDLHLQSKSRALLASAKDIYERIDDRTLYPWIAIGLAIQLDAGEITTAQAAGVINAFAEHGDSPTRCFKLHRVNFLSIRRVKTLLKGRYGIGWQRSFERASESKPGKPR